MLDINGMEANISHSSGLDIISSNHAAGKRTFILPLMLPDITLLAVDYLKKISYGVDVWELRVDLLDPGSEVPHSIPPLDFVAAQLRFLQTESDLPILFTIRTMSHGGKFPDKAVQEAFELMLLAVDMRCAYLDVEVSWPSFLHNQICEHKGDAMVIASFSDWSGDLRWSDESLLRWYEQTNSFGGEQKTRRLSYSNPDVYTIS